MFQTFHCEICLVLDNEDLKIFTGHLKIRHKKVILKEFHTEDPQILNVIIQMQLPQ